MDYRFNSHRRPDTVKLVSNDVRVR